MKITDVIDAEQIESLLDQHDSYSIYFGLMTVSRRGKDRAWYVYFQTTEVNVKLNPHASPMAYRELPEALEAAFSPALHERLKKFIQA